MLMAIRGLCWGSDRPRRSKHKSQFRPRRSFHCHSRLPCDSRAVGALVVLVAIQYSVVVVSPAGVRTAAIIPTPNDHFIAGPNCHVPNSARGGVGRACGYPTIRAGIVSAAGVEVRAVGISAPDNDLTARPNCRVKGSRIGCVESGGRCPRICAGIVSPAGVQRDGAVVSSAPDDHFTAGPDCGRKLSGQA